MNFSLTITEGAHGELARHLFPGDGKEAVAVVLCTRSEGRSETRFLVKDLFLVPHGACERTEEYVRWTTAILAPVLARCGRDNLSLFKIHSHPGGYDAFSEWDDAADRELFPSVYAWVDRPTPHGSLVMLPEGRIFGRVVAESGEFTDLEVVRRVGDDLHFYRKAGREASFDEAALRHIQAFGKGTYAALRHLTIGVVGYSGTGSPTVEQLARLGVGKLIVVDPDVIERRNLNRILNSTARDSRRGTPKVKVAKRTIGAVGLGTKVVTFQSAANVPEVARALSQCDVLFGCMDSVDGRHLLNRIASFYLIPYFDLGVRLDADGQGGVELICGTVHYIQPGRSSLLSRGVYNLKGLEAASISRTDPKRYEELKKAKYITGVAEDRPAVISVNMLAASLAVNEFLARLHPYRIEPSSRSAVVRFDLCNNLFRHQPEGESCPVFSKHTGKGDIRPLLDLPELSEAAL